VGDGRRGKKSLLGVAAATIWCLLFINESWNINYNYNLTLGLRNEAVMRCSGIREG
jgi:hypothetical protein